MLESARNHISSLNTYPHRCWSPQQRLFLSTGFPQCCVHFQTLCSAHLAETWVWAGWASSHEDVSDQTPQNMQRKMYLVGPCYYIHEQHKYDLHTKHVSRQMLWAYGIFLRSEFKYNFQSKWKTECAVSCLMPKSGIDYILMVKY